MKRSREDVSAVAEKKVKREESPKTSSKTPPKTPPKALRATTIRQRTERASAVIHYSGEGTLSLTPHAHVIVFDGLSPELAQKVLLELRDLSFESPLIRTPRGDRVPIPRGQCAIGDGNYRYGGMTVVPQPWTTTPFLAQARALLEERLDQKFSYALINRYMDGKQVVGWHSDDERDLEPGQSIVSLSLGATRKFRVRAKQARDKDTGERAPVHEFHAGHNVVIVMAGKHFQRDFVHTVPRESRVKDVRFNVTFRTLKQ